MQGFKLRCSNKEIQIKDAEEVDDVMIKVF